MDKKEEIRFWTESSPPKILNKEFIEFLEEQGISQVMLNETKSILVQERNKRIKKVSTAEMACIVRNHLKSKSLYAVYEQFIRVSGNLLGKTRTQFLNESKLVDGRDERNSANFYFKNLFVKVSKNNIELLDYSKLDNVIWEEQVFDVDYDTPKDGSIGQFEEFCKLISKNDDKRFLSLKTIIGYLIHKNKERGENRAIIFYDENMTGNGEANGRTGKTLLWQAIGRVRNVINFNGKELKKGQWFKNQRIDLSTDLIVYDDLASTVSLEEFFSVITSGIEIEKKHKDSYTIPYERSPKFIFTTNNYLKGPGGSSDRARRCEFELSNFFTDTNTPEKHFGNRFFEANWSSEENNKFYHFLMQCVQAYLKEGLIMPKSINLNYTKITSECPSQFVTFMDTMHFKPDTKYNRKLLRGQFKKFACRVTNNSMQEFGKWIKAYFKDKFQEVEFKSSNSESLFYLHNPIG